MNGLKNTVDFLYVLHDLMVKKKNMRRTENRNTSNNLFNTRNDTYHCRFLQHSLNTETCFLLHSLNTETYFLLHSPNTETYFLLHSLNTENCFLLHSLNT